MFSAQAFPAGSIFYDMIASEPHASELSLAPFELYRRPLVVLAIANGSSFDWKGGQDTKAAATGGAAAIDGSEQTPAVEKVDELLNELVWLRGRHQSALVHRLFVFDCPQGTQNASKDVVQVPTADQLKTTTMKTIMCDLTSVLLSAMAVLAQTIKSQLTVETPSSQSDNYENFRGRPGSHGNELSRPGSRLSEAPSPRSTSPAPNGDRSAYRASLPVHLASAPPQSPRADVESFTPSRESSRGPPVTFDEIHSGLSERSSSLPSADTVKAPSRESHPASASSATSISDRARGKAKGRIGVVIGSMYLLAGHWPDAVRELTDSAVLARSSNDHVWHAKALDYILVCMLLFGWAGMDFTIPSVCNPLAERESQVSKKASKANATDAPDLGALRSPPAVSRAMALQQLCGLLLDLVNNVLHLYIRAATFTVDKLPQLCFSESAVRLARLMACVQASHGTLNDQCLQSVILDTALEYQREVESEAAHSPSRSEIAWTLFRALPGPGMEQAMELGSLLRVYASAASVLSMLRYGRKKGFILREMVALLLPAIIQSRKDNAARLGVHPAASFSAIDLLHSRTDDGQLQSEDAPQSLSGFLNAMANAYGIVLPQHTSVSQHNSSQLNSTTSIPAETLMSIPDIIRRIMADSVKRDTGNPRLKFDILRSCLQICEALPDHNGITEYISALLLTAGRGVASGTEAANHPPLMPIDDQIRMVTMMKRTLGAAGTAGVAAVEGAYWDHFLVRDIRIEIPASYEPPKIRRRSNLGQSIDSATNTKGGPFIYNPFGAKAQDTSASPILILGERATITVLLQNLFDVDVDIEWIRLEATDSAIEAEVRSMVLGPSRLQEIRINAVPRVLGDHTISGCIAKISGCSAQRFPLFRAPWRPREATRLSYGKDPALALESTKPPEGSEKTETALPGPRCPEVANLQVQVIPNQTSVSLSFNAVFESHLLLLEGESKSFTATLGNPGAETVDFFAISLSDSVGTSLQSTLSDKELHPAQAYEAEYIVHHRKALRQVSQHDAQQIIQPQESLNIELEAYGKLGLKEGTLSIEYGRVGSSESDSSDVFFTRVVTTPLSFTVDPCIQLVYNDFLPFSYQSGWISREGYQDANGTGLGMLSPANQNFESSNRFQRLFRRADSGKDDHCLLLLDFRNSWSDPIHISLQVKEPVSKGSAEERWRKAYGVHDLVQPGAICRVVLLIPRLSVENPLRAIPSLVPGSKRQYVVSASKISPELERGNRELFWYREEVLKHVQAKWELSGTKRHGDINLRSLQVKKPMLEVLKIEEVQIELALRSSEEQVAGDEAVMQLGPTFFRAQADVDLVLVIRILNRSSQPFRPYLRLQPSLLNQPAGIALDITKSIGFNGLLQRPLPVVAASEVRETCIGLKFLCAGEYEVGASVEELHSIRPAPQGTEMATARPRADTGDLILSGQRQPERRTWNARHACTIHVVDLMDSEGPERET